MPSIHRPVKYKCELCDYRTASSAALQRHVVTSHNENLEVFCCPRFDFCKFLANSERSIELHQVVHNRGKGNQLCCPECNYKADFNRSGMYCFNCHILTHTRERPFKCQQCEQSYKSVSELNKHLRLKHPEKELKCEECSFTCFFQKLLEEHKDKFHPPAPVNKAQCSLCDFQALSQNTVQLHQVIHETQPGNPYSCPVCDYWTEIKKDYNKHILTHNNERAHICPHCEYRASMKTQLLRHIRSKHPDTKLQCETCEFSTFLPCDMEKHQQNHQTIELIKCPVPSCKFEATLSETMRLHQLVHNVQRKEWNYVCPECDKKLKTPTDFNNHIMVHTGDKPHKCEQCGMCFARAADMKKHAEKLH